METLLFYFHYGFILLFGIVLSLSFSNIQISKKKNAIIALSTFLVCALLQLISYNKFSEDAVWKSYPLICHLPILLLLFLYYRKNLLTAISSISTAYLYCQPAKWIGLLVYYLTENSTIELIVRIIVLIAVGILVLIYLSPSLSNLFRKDIKSVFIFGCIPIVYYLFDYTMLVYTDLWISNTKLVIEFLPFFLCIIFIMFCIFYYKEYEQKLDAKHNQEIIRIKSEEQTKEIAAIRRGEYEIRLLRHDMRLLLNTVLMCINEENYEKATELLSSYASQIDRTKLKHFCEIETINYIISHFMAKCETEHIDFEYDISINECKVDEVTLCSIISNVLDNAANAQTQLPISKRNISFMLKNFEGKILISVKNPIENVPSFIDGLPVSKNIGHGYGTQSVRYLTEKLKGNCQFTAKDNQFIARVII